MTEFQPILIKKRKIERSHRPEYQQQIDGDSIYTCSRLMTISNEPGNEDDNEEDGGEGRSSRIKKATNKSLEGPWHMELEHVLKRRDRQRFQLQERMRRRKEPVKTPAKKPKQRKGQGRNKTKEEPSDEAEPCGELEELIKADSDNDANITIKDDEGENYQIGDQKNQKKSQSDSNSANQESIRPDLDDQELNLDYECSNPDQPTLRPSSDLLRSIHDYSAKFCHEKGWMSNSRAENTTANSSNRSYISKKKQAAGQICLERSLDGTALMFLGVLIEEMVKEKLSEPLEPC